MQTAPSKRATKDKNNRVVLNVHTIKCSLLPLVSQLQIPSTHKAHPRARRRRTIDTSCRSSDRARKPARHTTSAKHQTARHKTRNTQVRNRNGQNTCRARASDSVAVGRRALSLRQNVDHLDSVGMASLRSTSKRSAICLSLYNHRREDARPGRGGEGGGQEEQAESSGQAHRSWLKRT